MTRVILARKWKHLLKITYPLTQLANVQNNGVSLCCVSHHQCQKIANITRFCTCLARNAVSGHIRCAALSWAWTLNQRWTSCCKNFHSTCRKCFRKFTLCKSKVKRYSEFSFLTTYSSTSVAAIYATKLSPYFQNLAEPVTMDLV